jgi:branched-subunit amino acid aminotransferase/4-amino-4-deoxychorismate lyase
VIDRRPEGRAVLDGAVVDADALLVPWPDPAAQWGLGVFETIAVVDGVPRHLALHLQRLDAAAARFGISLPAGSELARAAHQVAEGASARSWLKLVVSRSGRWAVFAGPDAGDSGRAVSAIVLPWRRHRLDPVAGIKSTGFAASLLGLEEARRRGADEGLWTNDRGHLVEACTANVFVVTGRAAVTPAIRDGARDGVMRALAIAALHDAGIQVRQGKLRLTTLRAAHEVFLTSSLGGVRPVVRIDGKNVRNGEPGPITRRLSARLSEQAASQRA